MEGRVIFALLILLDHRDHGIRSDEAGDVIHVAVSVVAGDSAIEPDDGLHAKIVGEHLFIGGAIHGQIALLVVDSKHSSVVIRVPHPLTSIDPPSSTMR